MNTASENKASGAPEYQVRLDMFEGPLDLLLYLVRKEEVELYELPLGRIVQQYLDYLAAVPQPDLDRAGDFIALAAHLIYLKSRRLLPPEQRPEGVDDSAEEEDPHWDLIRQLVEYKKFKDVAAHLIYLKSRRLLPPEQRPAGVDDSAEEEDPHWDLIRQLVEYKKFKDVAAHLQAVEINRLDLFPRPLSDLPAAGEDEEALAEAVALRDVGVFDLLGAFQRMLRRFEEKQRRDPGTVIFEENFTVADKIMQLQGRVAAGGGQPLAFSALFTEAASRVELVVTLLALLELVRLKQLRVVQSAAFEEIMVYGVDAVLQETGGNLAESRSSGGQGIPGRANRADPV